MQESFSGVVSYHKGKNKRQRWVYNLITLHKSGPPTVHPPSRPLYSSTFSTAERYSFIPNWMSNVPYLRTHRPWPASRKWSKLVIIPNWWTLLDLTYILSCGNPFCPYNLTKIVSTYILCLILSMPLGIKRQSKEIN